MRRIGWTFAVQWPIGPHVNDVSADENNGKNKIPTNKGIFFLYFLPNGNVFGRFVAVPVLARSENLSAIWTIDDGTAPGVLGQTVPSLIVRIGCGYFDHNLFEEKKRKKNNLSKQINFFFFLIRTNVIINKINNSPK